MCRQWDWDDGEIAAAQTYNGLVASLLWAAVTALLKVARPCQPCRRWR